MLTAVVPTLNAARTLPACLAALGEVPVVVADGGSTDDTRLVARSLGATVVTAPRGRGAQLVAGSERALAEGASALLIVHADTVLAEGWRAEADAHLHDHPGQAAAFRLAFDEDSRAARRVAALANGRARRLGLPYGDQGLLVPAETYRAVGGFRPLPLMEDVDLVRRLRPVRILETAAVTSAERYRRGGWVLRPLRNLSILGLYFAGVPPRLLARLYG